MKRFTNIYSLLIPLLMAGCSSSDSPFEYVPVSGKVSYEDGSLIPDDGFVVKFFALDAPQVQGASPRIAQADVGSTGEFNSATSYKTGDGLIPGKHRVSFLYADDKSGKSLVPTEYTVPKESPLIVDTAQLPLEIKVPKP